MNKIIITLALCAIATYASAQSKQRATGDVNGDGSVNISDVTCLVNQILTNKYENITVGNGHEYVDLGLSVKWATMNVGATEVAGSKVNPHTNKLDCYGEYYAWGETIPKDSYEWSNLLYCNSSDGSKFTKYVASSTYGTVDDKIQLEFAPTCDDVARAYWGGTWRIPTTEELKELIYNCYWAWTTSYNGTGVAGYIVYKVKDDSDKGKYPYNKIPTPTASYSLSDTHIFLPAAGSRRGSNINSVGKEGKYWSSSLNSFHTGNALELSFVSNVVEHSFYDRYNGFSIRAVCP